MSANVKYTIVSTGPMRPSQSISVDVPQHYSEQDMIAEIARMRASMADMTAQLNAISAAWSAKYDKNRWILATEAAKIKNRSYNTIKNWCSDRYSGRSLKHQISEDGKLMVWVADLDRFSNGKAKFLE